MFVKLSYLDNSRETSENEIWPANVLCRRFYCQKIIDGKKMKKINYNNEELIPFVWSLRWETIN